MDNNKVDLISRLCGATYNPNTLFEVQEALCHAETSLGEIEKLTVISRGCEENYFSMCNFLRIVVKPSSIHVFNSFIQ